MLTRPAGLCDGDVEKVIEEAWGIAVTSLEYRPIGFGSHHWAASGARGVRHFVTVDELSAESRGRDEVSVLGLHLRPALTAATDLRAFGCRFVVAPIATKTDGPFARFDRYAVALYPFIDGQGFSFEEPFGEADRERVLELVAALHMVPVAAIRPPATDEFVVPLLDQLDRALGPRGCRRWTVRSDRLSSARRQRGPDQEDGRRYQALLARHLKHPGPLVVTHGEIHPGNVMVTPEGWVIVDWDTALVAPPERDLWRLAGEEVDRSFGRMPTPLERLPTNGSSTSMPFAGIWPRSPCSQRSSGGRTKTPRTAGRRWRSFNRS